MVSAFDFVLEGISKIFEWMDSIECYGITLTQAAAFTLLMSLFWRFVLSPLFGRSGGSLSAGVSDTVRSQRSHNDRSAFRRK